MQLRHAIASRSQTFLGAKSLRPIPHPGGLVGDALVQLSLDPDVFRLEFRRATQPEASGITRVFGVICVERRDGPHYLDVVPARRVRSIRTQAAFDDTMAALGLRPLTLTGEEIMREPRFRSARTVWQHRRFRTNFDTRYRIKRILADVIDMSLDELCSIVSGPQDPLLSVLSMACADLLEIDLESQAIGPATRVRWRE